MDRLIHSSSLTIAFKNSTLASQRMASPLIIRNLTGRFIELKKSEYYDAIRGNTAGRTSFTSGITSFWWNTTISSAPSISTATAGFVGSDLSIRLDPFASCQTGIVPHSRDQTLRLTFETEGERHRLETPAVASTSVALTPLNQNPRFKYTAIHLLEHSHITLYCAAHLTSWMQYLRDDLPLSVLSIPGTHNSPTCHRALPSVRCQAVPLREQLDNGVRFLDVRVQPENPLDPAKDGLILVHSVFPISLTGNKYFRELLKDVFSFLDNSPGETVIMSIKREGTGNATDAQLSRILKDHYASDMSRWFTAPRIPELGEVRGKVVLIRRFGVEDRLRQEWGGAGWGIDAENWEDNTPNATCPGGDICVQDFYEVLDTVNIEKKIKYCEEHLTRAAQCVCALQKNMESANQLPVKQPFFINFLTASNFWKVGCWPERIAAKLNPAIVDFLCRKHNEKDHTEHEQGGQIGNGGNGSTGIVVCDWVGHKGNWDLVKCIVGMNAKLMT